MTKKTPPPRSRTDHMANERTFLAWIRTSLGIMAFGFVVEKFAFFIKQFALFIALHGVKETQSLVPKEQNYSSLFGIALVAIGALLGLFSFVKYKKIEKQIEEDRYQHSSMLSVALTVLVVLIGVFLVVYLVEA